MTEQKTIKRMSGLEINVVLHEIRQKLLGLRVINVYSINKRTYLLKLSGTNSLYPTTTKQYLIIESGVRLHLTDYEREIDSTPNGLATTIRRHLKGKMLMEVNQCGLDRILQLHFGQGQTSYNLFVELFGTGNIVLADYEYSILALLKQQAYGTSLLGAPTTAPTAAPNPLDPTPPAPQSNTVTLRSKYQWDQQQQATVFPQSITSDFVLSLFQNKHQRLLEQQQVQDQLDAAAAVSGNDVQPQAQSHHSQKKAPRKKDKSAQISVKQVLYESILGPQLSLHGSTQTGIDINLLYTTALTDIDYLSKLITSLQYGLSYHQQLVSQCAGYLHCRLTTSTSITIANNGITEETTAPVINNFLITQDFSPGNLAQTTISPNVYIQPTTSQSSSTSTQTNDPALEPPSDAVVSTTSNEPLSLLFTHTECINKLPSNTKPPIVYQTFELPSSGYQAFNWGLITPTSTITTTQESNDNDKKKNNKKQQRIDNDSTPTITAPTVTKMITTTTQIKDVWFYCANFSHCVDIYYGTKDIEKEIVRVERERFNVLNRIEKTKHEQMTKLQHLSNDIDAMLLKAQLIENNITVIQRAIDLIHKHLNMGRDWLSLAQLVEQQKLALNPIALLIDRFHFDDNNVIVQLSWNLEHMQIFMNSELSKRREAEKRLQQQHAMQRSAVSANKPTQTNGDNDDEDYDDEDDEDYEDEDDQGNGQEEDEDDEDEPLIVDDTTEEAQVEAQEEHEQEKIKGSAKQPIKVTIDYTQSAYANAQVFYSYVKELTRKKQVAEQFSQQAIKLIETKGQKELHQVKDIQAKQRRKMLWFEKFHWFVTSENILVIAGRDATQNELIVKRYLDTNDLYFHADLHGASSVVVKVPHSYVQSYQQQFGTDKPITLPQLSIQEAAAFTTCHSNAWLNKTNNTRAYWVYAHQVSKIPPTGMYLEKGSFMIRGNKNYVEPQALEMGIGLLFRCGDEETTLRHAGERTVRSLAQSNAADALNNDKSASANKAVNKNDDKESAAKKLLMFQQEQNKKQVEQETKIARLEEEERQRILLKQQREQNKKQSLQAQPSISSATTASLSIAPSTMTNLSNITHDSSNIKRFLTKNVRYQMKKLGMTDANQYWIWKEEQSKLSYEQQLEDSTPVIDGILVPHQDDDGNDDEDDDDDDDDLNEEEKQSAPTKKKKKHTASLSDGDSDDDTCNNNDQDDDEDDDEEEPVEADIKSTPVSIAAPSTAPTTGKAADKTGKGGKGGKAGKDNKNKPTQPETATGPKLGKGKKSGKANKKGFQDDDDDEDNGIFDPTRFLSEDKVKKLQSILAPSSSSDDDNKKPQHGVNKKKGKTKQARLENQRIKEEQEAEAKRIRQQAALEREQQAKARHLAKQQLVADKRAAKQLSQEALNSPDENTAVSADGAPVVTDPNNNDEFDANNDNLGDDDDDDEFTETSLLKLQQLKQDLEGTEYVLSTLTSKPLLGDYITHAIPIVAPYHALHDYQYRVKLIPGGGKKGQTIKDSIHVFSQTTQSLYRHPPSQSQSNAHKLKDSNSPFFEQLNPEEQQQILQEKQFQQLHTSLIKQINDNELSLAMISSAKVSVQGIQFVHRQQKQQKKRDAKLRDKQKGK